MYGEQTNMNFDESSFNYITEPGVYEGKIKEVKKYITKAGDNALVFVLEGIPVTITGPGKTQPEPGGTLGEISIFELPQTDPEKARKQQERVGVIMKRFINETLIKEMKGVTDWPSYQDFVMNAINPKASATTLVWKVVPSIFDSSNPGVQIPKYKGAIVLKTAVDLTFGLSAREKQEIPKLQALRGASTNTSSPGTVASQADAGNLADPNNLY